MNIVFYVMAIIILILIIGFISLKYYLSTKYVINIIINDSSNISDPLINECFYNHKIHIIYCKYLINGKKYNITNQINNKSQFNAINFNLPSGGVFKIGYVCYDCKKNGKKNNFVNLAGIGGDSISIPNDDSYNGQYFSTSALQNIYNEATENYDLTQNTPLYETLKNETNMIPIHSSSTQNSIFWNNLQNNNIKNNIQKSIQDSMQNSMQNSNIQDSKIADLMSMEKKINASIETNNIDLLLNDIEEEENKQNPHFINDTPFSSYVNIFIRKYPALSATNVLGGYIDPEFIPDGLYGSAKLLNEVITN
jgi:hypothetical protein